ncbi:hypothetical protein [Cellulomonas endometrii]|uniref:hypothetical protein n=1 Tax=Cellulomonas endometrii TaxID=3036301 RepID=UPI0024ACCD16|nr:hypothetical protein [Cellulomonas endometrii]
MHAVTTALTADYSQLEMYPGRGGRTYGPVVLGLADDQVSDMTILATARQNGVVPAEVQVHDDRPPLDPRWDAAAEWSVRTGAGMSLGGWAHETSVAVPVAAGLDVRVRYVVVDGQAGADQLRRLGGDELPAERYLLQVWPAPVAPAEVVVADAPWAQYWAFGPSAAALVAGLSGMPDPDRLVAVVDRALDAHPDVRARVAAGDDRSRLGVVRYTQELFRVTHRTGAYDHVRGDHEAIAALIDERARR